MARDVQARYGQEPQVVLTMPLLEGLDGVDKMSKTSGNYVGINESANEQFGKIMSISDDLMFRYYELLTDKDVDAIRQNVAGGVIHPKEAKKELAISIIAQYHGRDDAIKAAAEFDKVFKEKGVPSDVRKMAIGSEGIGIVDLLTTSGICKSKAEARRLIEQGAVSIDNIRVTDINLVVKPKEKSSTLKAGKRAFLEFYKE
jgi:tyrosyl-tRNA synthetase